MAVSDFAEQSNASFNAILKPREGSFDASSLNMLPSLSISIDEGTLVFYFATSSALNAALLDKQDPNKILWRSVKPVWETSEEIKPVKLTIENRTIVLCFEKPLSPPTWKINLSSFLADFWSYILGWVKYVLARFENKMQIIEFSLDKILGLISLKKPTVLERTHTNPILQPNPESPWESCYVFNPAVLFLKDKVHFVYRAIGESGLSVFGYAASNDGIHIDERSTTPIFISKDPQECKKDAIAALLYPYESGGSWTGCEDPRLTMIDDTIYMVYTAFNGTRPPGVALTSISVNDFINKQWNWQNPVLMSSPGEIHKNWVIFPEKINGKYAILHSITPNILIDYLDTLDLDDIARIESHYSSGGRDEYWDNWVRGVGPPPIKTEAGWLVLYHAMDREDPNKYKVGAMILGHDDPTKILYRSNTPLLEPDAHYENDGFKAGVVYTCGAVIIDEKLFVYYGGADTVICAASVNLNELLEHLKDSSQLPSLETAYA